LPDLELPRDHRAGLRFSRSAAKRDHDRLDSWLQRFARAWEERDPDGAAALFSDATRLELDGILLLSLNDDGRCEDFREWSNRRLVAAPPATG
jgi:hypothetical protein